MGDPDLRRDGRVGPGLAPAPAAPSPESVVDPVPDSARESPSSTVASAGAAVEDGPLVRSRRSQTPPVTASTAAATRAGARHPRTGDRSRAPAATGTGGAGCSSTASA